jgi:predicted transcriptional regulator
MPRTTSLKLPEELKEKVSTLSHGVAQTPHAYMVEAITEKVARDEKRRSFLEDAKRSREDVERTGKVYRFEDVARWAKVIAKCGSCATRTRRTRKPRPGSCWTPSRFSRTIRG